MDHSGITVFGSPSNGNIKRITLGKAKYDSGTDTYIDVEAKIAVWDNGGTMQRWARMCPDASISVTVDSYPTDGDPYFRYTYNKPDPTYYATTVGVTITRVSTGTTVGEYSSGVLASAGPGEQYNFALTAQITSDYDIPTDFRPYQYPGNVATGSASMTDPRAII